MRTKWNEYRCTRNAMYMGEGVIGRTDRRARQGHYVAARSESEALADMIRMFPGEESYGFTVDLWDVDVWRLWIRKLRNAEGDEVIVADKDSSDTVSVDVCICDERRAIELGNSVGFVWRRDEDGTFVSRYVTRATAMNVVDVWGDHGFESIFD